MERAEAIKKGLERYYTGRACKHGHKAERHSVSGACMMCIVVNNRESREKAKEQIKAAQAA